MNKDTIENILIIVGILLIIIPCYIINILFGMVLTGLFMLHMSYLLWKTDNDNNSKPNPGSIERH